MLKNNSLNSQISLINALFKMVSQKENAPFSLVDVLRKEILKLRQLNEEYKQLLTDKRIVSKESNKIKDLKRYHLQDGSTYVIRSNYKYLYDNKTRIITYQFKNGQIERTFPNGIKEIRYTDGSIGIRHGNNDYDYITTRK
ncbi:putative T-complex 10/CenJ [Pseudoloma neurophilia]|uniref:Putative T-complex 10/CenJ n=1 Tax=Pseudoloma neurophilia TaxID=146866 RepID=A0A0R0LZA6_9MICR|nr:putative T-complex 10/CenJ [Pseudoloma neurophilia]